MSKTIIAPGVDECKASDVWQTRIYSIWMALGLPEDRNRGAEERFLCMITVSADESISMERYCKHSNFKIKYVDLF